MEVTKKLRYFLEGLPLVQLFCSSTNFVSLAVFQILVAAMLKSINQNVKLQEHFLVE